MPSHYDQVAQLCIGDTGGVRNLIIMARHATLTGAKTLLSPGLEIAPQDHPALRLCFKCLDSTLKKQNLWVFCGITEHSLTVMTRSLDEGKSASLW